MTEQELREQICEVGRRMYDRRMVAANDGNISVRLGDNEFLCTPTGVSKGFMTPESICKVDIAGNLLEDNGSFRPSSEFKMHARVYEKREDVGAVVHAHPSFATTFAVMGRPLDKPIMTEAVVSLGYVPLAPFATPSTAEVPDSIEPFLDSFDQVLLANHGALTFSDNVINAYMKMESVEFYAELLYRTECLGGTEALSDKQVDKLYDIRRGMNVSGRHPFMRQE